MIKRHLIALSSAFLLLAIAVAAQAPQPTAAPPAKPEEGIPITDATVLKACGSCHKSDDKGQMSRISFQRNTPEGWQDQIQRMAALNGTSDDLLRETMPVVADHITLPDSAAVARASAQSRSSDERITGPGPVGA